MSIGNKITQARKELNLTQADLAKKIGLKNRAMIGAWETGPYKPSAKNLEKLAKALGKDYSYFYEEGEAKAGVKKIEKVIINIPTLGIIKDKEVIFVPSTSIPKKEDVAMKVEFDIEVTDDKLPPYKKKEMVHVLAVDSIKGYEGRRFIVKNSNGVCSVMQLEKPNSKYEVLAVVLGRYIPEE